MIIMGIDPGLSVTGWAILRNSAYPDVINYGSVKTSSDSLRSARLYKIHREITEIIARHKPDCIVLEKVFVNMNPHSSMRLENLRGAIILTVAMTGLKLYEYTPAQIKKAVTGSGSATKEDVEGTLRRLTGLNDAPISSDAADALAAAFAYNPYSSLEA